MLTVRPTIEAEAEALCRIQKEAFLPLYEKYHDDGNPYLRGTEDITNRLNSPFFRYYTIFENGETVGGILYRCSGRGIFFDSLGKGEYYLQRIYVKPSVQSKGIASGAIRLCESEFTDAVKFYVDFPEDLEKNRRCYEKAGFRDTGRRFEIEKGLTLAFYEKITGSEAQNF